VQGTGFGRAAEAVLRSFTLELYHTDTIHLAEDHFLALAPSSPESPDGAGSYKDVNRRSSCRRRLRPPISTQPSPASTTAASSERDSRPSPWAAGIAWSDRARRVPEPISRSPRT